jgi:hypothetical protein
LLLAFATRPARTAWVRTERPTLEGDKSAVHETKNADDGASALISATMPVIVYHRMHPSTPHPTHATL